MTPPITTADEQQQQSPRKSPESVMTGTASDDDDMSDSTPTPSDKDTSSPTMPKRRHEPSSCAQSMRWHWKYMMDSLRKTISDVVVFMADHAARHPISYVVGITVFSFTIMGIGFFTNFDMSLAAEDYLTPVNSVIREQRQWIREESNFPPKPHSVRIFVHNQGDNVVTREGVNKTFEIVNTIQNTQGYQELCEESQQNNNAGYGGNCHVRGVPLFWNLSQAYFEETVHSETDLLLKVSATNYPDGSNVDLRELMGHWHFWNGTAADIVERAESFILEAVIPAAQSHSKDLAVDVLNDLLELQEEWIKSGTTYRVEVYMVDESLEAETVRAVFYDLPLIPSVFVIMSIFTCIVFSMSEKKDNGKCQTRFLLGFGAVACILMSLATSYGILFIIGVPFTSTTQMLPFIMFGIGLDDAFIIFGQFIRTDKTKDPADRIRDTMEEVGLSVFMTTLTTTLAFALGGLGTVPTLIWMAYYAFPTVAIDFIYQITFFVAVIVIDERRIANKANREKVVEVEDDKLGDKSTAQPKGVKSVPVAEASCGEMDPVAGAEERESQSSQQDESLKEPQGPRESGVDHLPQASSGMDRFMSWYANKLLTPIGKAIVLIAFVCVIVVGAFATSLFEQEFNIYDVLMTDSYVAGYFRALDNYADTGFIVAQAYFRGDEVDQSDPDIQAQMEEYVTDLVGIDAITKEPPFFWLQHFKEFLTYDDRLLDLTFNQQVDVFLSIDAFRILYGDHIVRDPDTGDVIASRCVMLMDNVNMKDVNSQIQAWRDQLDVTEEQPINSEVYRSEGDGFNFFLHESNLIFGFEFYGVFKDELILSSAVGVLTITMVTFFLLPHWSAPLFLGPMISVLYIGMIGFLHLCGAHLNAISYFTLIMSIGLLVDFNMHILLRYYESPCKTRENKVKDALQTMGSSVVIGGLTTFLGVVPLLFSTSTFMMTLFFGFWGMVILGCFGGVAVLPVILSFVGPLDTTRHMEPLARDSMRPSSNSTKLLPTTSKGPTSFTSSPTSDSDDNTTDTTSKITTHPTGVSDTKQFEASSLSTPSAFVIPQPMDFVLVEGDEISV